MSVEQFWEAVTVRDLGRSLDFQTVEELSSFVEGELAAWEPVFRLERGLEGFMRSAIQAQEKPLLAAKEWIERSNKGGNPDIDLLSTLRDGLQAGGYVVSSSPTGLHILSSVGANPIGGVLLLAERSGSLDDASPYAVALAAARIVSDVNGKTSAQDSSNELLRGEVSKYVDKFRREMKGIIQQYRKSDDFLIHSMRMGEMRWVEFTETSRDMFHGMLDRYETEMARIRKTYMEDMRLRSASSYWREKEAVHAFSANIWLGVFCAVSFFVLISAFGLLPLYIRSLPNDTGIASLAAVSLPVVIILWTLRHLSRLFVTHFQQREDARQRRALVTTYMALTHKDKAGDAERLLILHALFRPNATKDDDDLGAQSLVDSLAKQFVPKS